MNHFSSQIIPLLFTTKQQFVEAARRGDVQTVRSCLKMYNTKDKIFHDAFWFACRELKPKVAELLLEHGADPNTRYSPFVGYCVLHRVISAALGTAEEERQSGQKLLNLLILHGADPNAGVDWNGRSPFLLALSLIPYNLSPEASSDYFDVIKLLLAHGADLNAKDTKGRTALFEVLGKGWHWIDFLLGQGANIKLRDSHGFTLLHRLVFSNPFQKQVVQNLIDRGMALDATNDKGETALCFLFKSCFSINLEAAKFLLKAGAKVDFPDSVRGRTALHHAAFRRHHEGLVCLLQHGANVNTQDFCGNTALHLVTENAYRCCGHIPFDSSFSILDCLLSHGANPCSRNVQGETPLELACHTSDCVDRLCQSTSPEIRRMTGIPLSSLDFIFRLLQATVQEDRDWVALLRDGPKKWMHTASS